MPNVRVGRPDSGPGSVTGCCVTSTSHLPFLGFIVPGSPAQNGAGRGQCGECAAGSDRWQCTDAQCCMTRSVRGLPEEEADPRHSPHHLKEKLTSDHWASLQMHNMQSSCLRSRVRGSTLPSVHLGLRPHQNVPGASAPPPGKGAVFGTRPVRGRARPPVWAAGNCGGHGGVTEARAQCQGARYGLGGEVSSWVPGGRAQ